MMELALDVMSESKQQRCEELVERVSVCRLLAQLYRRELERPMVDMLQKAGVLEHLERHGFQLEAERLGDPVYLKELRLEYTRLFIGPGPHIAPYGSVHHPKDSRQGQLWGQTTKEVRRIALDHGLKFGGPSYDGIPDHVGHVLELYALLLEAELEALSNGDAKRVGRLRNSQQYLLEKQIMAWVPDFCQKVRQQSKLPFYGEVARLTDEFLSGENALRVN